MRDSLSETSVEKDIEKVINNQINKQVGNGEETLQYAHGFIATQMLITIF